MSWNQLTAYMPFYLRELHVAPDQVPRWIAAISSVGWILALPLAPFWGVLADRYSRKLIIVRSAVLEAVVFAGWAFSTSPWMALVFSSLNGFILGNTGVMLAVQASTTPRQRLALAIGIVGAAIHWPVYRLIGFLATHLSSKEDEMVATLKVIGGLVLYPLMWIAIAVAIAVFFTLPLAIAVLIAQPILGYVALITADTFEDIAARLHHRDLGAQQQRIRDEILAVARELNATSTLSSSSPAAPSGA